MKSSSRKSFPLFHPVARIPVTPRVTIEVVEDDFGMCVSRFALDCRVHRRDDCVHVCASSSVDMETGIGRAVARLVLAAALQDKNEYTARVARILNLTRTVGRAGYLRQKAVFAEYLSCFLADPLPVLRALGEMGDLPGLPTIPGTLVVARPELSGGWKVHEYVGPGFVFVAESLIYVTRGLVVTPALLALCTTCHEFVVLGAEVEDAVARELAAVTYPDRIWGSPWIQVLVAAVARGVLRVLERVDDILLS